MDYRGTEPRRHAFLLHSFPTLTPAFKIKLKSLFVNPAGSTGHWAGRAPWSGRLLRWSRGLGHNQPFLPLRSHGGQGPGRGRAGAHTPTVPRKAFRVDTEIDIASHSQVSRNSPLLTSFHPWAHDNRGQKPARASEGFLAELERLSWGGHNPLDPLWRHDAWPFPGGSAWPRFEGATPWPPMAPAPVQH